MQLKVRHSINGKIIWAILLIPSLILTLQMFLLGIQNFGYENYFIIFPLLLLVLLLSYLVLLLFRTSAPILIEGDTLTFAETFSFHRKRLLISQILSMTVVQGLVGARVRLQDEDGLYYSVGCLNAQDVLALRELAAFYVF